MSSSSVLPSSVQNQQHPFLYQPQIHQYSSGDDGDSPPSLTNSSESPRSTSEEGDTSLLGFDLVGQGQSKSVTEQNNSALLRDPQSSWNSREESQGNVKGEDSLMSPIQAVSPNWESVFASSIGTDNMDMSASSLNDVDAKQWRSVPESINAAAANSNSRSIGGNANQTNSGTESEMWPNQSFSNAFQSCSTFGNDAKANDEAMFDSLIQEDSFEQSNEPRAEDNETPATSGPLSINTSPTSLPTASQSANSMASANGLTPPQSAQPSTSALSSRRNSIEQDGKPKMTRIPHCGSHYSHTSDADLPTSSQVIVRPPRSELKGLQVHVHGISFTGAKSRVETQIRTRIELVRPVAGDSKDGAAAFERIGSFNHVKLPPLTGTKRKSKKHKPNDIAAENTLFMDATVVRATPPHDRVLVCSSCQQRERKRAQRKRTGSRKSEDKAMEDEVFSPEELHEYGIDPQAHDAQEQARNRATQEDEKRVVVFNCGDFINFEDGACVLPTRITCYCRHHKEKTGFCLIFTMRDYRGNLIATGSTPPIMITDDHKSVAAAQAAVSSTPTSGFKKLDGARSRGASSEAIDESTLRSIGQNVFKKKRNHRARPYGDADDRASRRNTLQSSSMTPYTSTGQNTPAIGHSPPSQSDMNQPEFWHAFAAMSSIANSPPVSSHRSTQAQTPHDTSSPVNQTSPLQQNNVNTNGHDWLANIGNQGSLSSQTLNLSPQSLPGFDLNAFSTSLQQSGQQAGDEATMQQLLMLARSLPGMGNSVNQSMDADPRSALVPTISKLIPGEGPTSGGIEVTILGENFTENLTCLFGDVPATSTRVWGSNTLLCILPPSASPGPVAVSIRTANGEVFTRSEQDRFGRSLQLFTYIDATDRALMELALQVVGLQMTGQMQTARDVAMRVVGSGSNQTTMRTSESSTQQQSSRGHQQMRSAVPGLFASGTSNQSFQDSVLSFLTTLDVDEATQRRDAIRLANKQGHTLLHLTVILGFHRLAANLIQRGCPINARDHNGYTALHFAALHGRMTIARLLLGHGASVDVECDSGNLPIDIAREREQVDVEFLLEDCMGGDYSDEDSLESDWTTDNEEEVDADNISTQRDAESINGAFSTEDLASNYDDEKLAGLLGAGPTLQTLGPSLPAEEEKMNLKAAEEMQGSEKASLEARGGLKGLVSGGMDLAQRWPNAAMGKIGMPLALHDRFNSMQLPTVSVFQMVMPPNFMNWNGAGNEVSEGEEAHKGKAKDDATREQSSDSRTLTLWRNIFEESALWINPLYSPPPTYESSIERANNDNQGGIKEKSPEGRGSRFPAIAKASPDSPHKNDEIRRRKAQRFDLNSCSASWHPETSSSSSSSSQAVPSRPFKSTSSSSLPTKINIKTTPTPRRLKEDRMLVYFWIPILIFVILLLCFAKPSSVLSYKDLISFMPI